MNLKNIFSMALVSVILLGGTISCKSKISDADLQAKVETAVQSNPNIQVEVKDGVVRLNGTVTTDDERLQLEKAAKAADPKAVKSVVSNIIVSAAPTVEINDNDADLTTKVTEFTKDFPSITTSINEGVITVNGELEQAKVQTLKMGLDALNPKKVDMSGLIIK